MKIKNDEGRRRENVPGMGKVARGVGDAEQYSLFIGHFVTIAFESRFTLLVARSRPCPAFTVSRRSRIVSCRI